MDEEVDTGNDLILRNQNLIVDHIGMDFLQVIEGSAKPRIVEVIQDMKPSQQIWRMWGFKSSY
jgi:hypothetical protein